MVDGGVFDINALAIHVIGVLVASKSIQTARVNDSAIMAAMLTRQLLVDVLNVA